jgi:GNAT superfamily N-acetyltransferase
MTLSNFERMIQLAGEAFDTKNDPEQLDVDEKIIERLLQIHPASVSEYDNGHGPVVWILMIPTSLGLMEQFIDKKISEKELFGRTQPGWKYEAVYLCSAMVLEEYRGKGIAKRLTLEAIEKIRKHHPLKKLFVWPFSKEGDGLAETISRETALPLLKR